MVIKALSGELRRSLLKLVDEEQQMIAAERIEVVRFKREFRNERYNGKTNFGVAGGTNCP